MTHDKGLHKDKFSTFDYFLLYVLNLMGTEVTRQETSLFHNVVLFSNFSKVCGC